MENSTTSSTLNIGPFSMLRSLYSQRQLIARMVAREVSQRYRGSFLGVAWSFITPLAMLATYTFVFSTMFKPRWQDGENIRVGEYALQIFAGLLAFNVFAEVIAKSPMLIVSVPNYVKKVVFPLEILPVVALGGALVNMCISALILIIGEVLILRNISNTIWLFPLACLPLILVTLGLSWFFSSLGVYVRDVWQGIGIIIQGLLFVSPVFYRVSDPLYYINPLTIVLDSFRSTLIDGQLLNWEIWGACTAISAILAWVGFVWFTLTKRGFADVI